MKVVLVVLFSVALIHYGYSNTVDKNAGPYANDTKPLEWWQRTVLYQLYPRSFQDSNGDGIGDLNGITSKLDHFVDIGVEAIWICPIYQSPMVDFGYDISNFTNIEPDFGTLEDFRRMADEFHKRDLKLIMDQVPNHSSDQHEWFKKSIQGEEPYRNYYVWKNASGTDPDGKPLPPNNWVSVFGGSSWEWNDQRQQFYLHQFAKEQPDLNFENIEVRNEILAVVKFWLDTGVDGIRVDAVPFLYEDPDWRDEPPNPDRDPAARPDEYRYWLHPYTYNLPTNLDYLVKIRQLLDIYTKSDGKVRVMIVESTVPDEYIMDYYGTPDKPIAHFPFNFHLMGVRPDQTATQILDQINIWYDLMPEGEWATFLIGSHDQKRAATRWTEASIDGANMINLLLRGTAVTYYGEEIGMTDTFLTWEETVDPQACNTDPERYHEFSRDPARTPMQWNNQTNAGFSTGNKTWLPVNPNYVSKNLAAQEAAEESHLKVYKELTKLRKTEAWISGSYEYKALSNDRVLGFTRIPPSGSNSIGFVVLVNLSWDQITVSTATFARVPSEGTVRTRSINFDSRGALIGQTIDTRGVLLGARDAIVIEFTPTA